MTLSQEELEKYLKKVAHFLGGWRVDIREEHYVYLIGEGLKILVRNSGWRQSEKGKLFFIGVLKVITWS
jgi:hypothetical protein